MILSVFGSYCILELLIIYCNVFGEEEEDVYFRFLKEEGFKPPIFGSYHYDPIKQEFEIPVRHSHKNVSQIVNSSYVLSTAIGIDDVMNVTDAAVYRQHVTVVTKRPVQWWAMKLSRTTKNQRLNFNEMSVQKYN